MAKIQKKLKWFPYRLNEQIKEKRKTKCEIFIERQQKKSVIELSPVMKNEFIGMEK